MNNCFTSIYFNYYECQLAILIYFLKLNQCTYT